MRLSELAPVLGAVLQGEAFFEHVSIDSRTLTPGCLFISIQGDNFDGHAFIEDAVARGAVAVMVSKKGSFPVPSLEVTNTTKSLGELAAYWRKQFKLPVIGVTGSCGKTTVKTMTAAIMRQKGSICVTEGNLNNEIGVPLTVLGLTTQDKAAVFEMGAGTLGDIAYLSKIAQPTIGIITCVAPAHLKGFGSLENIARTKGEIYENLPEHGVAVINIDENFVGSWQQLAAHCSVLTYGLDKKAQFYASEIVLNALDSKFIIHTPLGDKNIQLSIPGLHNVRNALAACAGAYAAGASLEEMAAGLEEATAVKGRLQVLEGFLGSCIIDDSYNANPGSVRAALEVLSQFSGERVFVLGTMAELGVQEREFHRDIGLQAKRLKIDRFMGLGSLALAAVDAFGEGAILFDSMEDLIVALRKSSSKQTTVLVKGSRSSGMERVVRALTEEVSS
jgi:UDP-N-acetylmuramoyl-tripeptide--D-alanyl-D-alanine ligase